MFRDQCRGMRLHKGCAAALGLLCSVAATVAVWSGPLAAASGDLRSNAASIQVGASAHTAK